MSSPVEVVAAWAFAGVGVAPALVALCPGRFARRMAATGGAPIRALGALARPSAVLVAQALSLVSVAAVAASVGPLDPDDLWSVLVVVTLALVAGVALWTAVRGPWPALRLEVPAALVVLTVAALEPLAPAALLASASTTAADDLASAALLLVVGGSAPPFLAAALLLIGWVRAGGPAAAKPLVLSGRTDLTTGDVHREFDRLGPSRHREPPTTGPAA